MPKQEYMLGSPVKDTQPLPVLTAMKDEVKSTKGKKQKSLSAWGATFTCANACIGAGVLAFPNVFANGGFLLTPILMAVVICLELITLSVLVSKSQLLGVTQYQIIVEKIYGTGMSVFFSILISLYMFGALVAYTIVIGDTLTSLAIRHLGPDNICSSHSFDISVIGLFLLLPLSLKRNFSDLQWVSYIAIMSIGYIMVAVLIRSIQSFEQNDWKVFEEVKYFPSDFSSVMNAIPVISFAFVCHLQVCEVAKELGQTNGSSNMFSRKRSSADVLVDGVYHSLQATESTSLLGGGNGMSPSKVNRTMRKVCAMALAICALGYGSIGTFAYLASPNKWKDISDLLLGYGVDDNLMEVGRIALVINICSSFPINLGPCRSAVMDIVQRIFKNKLHDGALSAVTTTCLVVGSILTGLVVRQLGVVFKIIGGTVGALLIFLLPGLMLLSSNKKKGCCSTSYFTGIVLCIFGIALFVCTVVSYFY